MMRLPFWNPVYKHLIKRPPTHQFFPSIRRSFRLHFPELFYPISRICRMIKIACLLTNLPSILRVIGIISAVKYNNC